jgi:hypothetical protein
LRGVSKDGRLRVAHPSRLGMKNAEHLRMTVVGLMRQRAPRAAPQEKSRLAAGLSFSLTALPQFSSELAVALALLTLAALAVWILLLLAGLLAAALLLAGLLTRVLILLARILVLVGHSGSPYLRCWGCNGETTAKAQVWFPKKLRFPHDHCVAQICPDYGFGTGKTTRVQPLKPHPALLPLPVPTVKKRL